VAGDLDLLISRSLDGDLSGDEERELHDVLAADPFARARYDAMARVVGRLEELPDPEPPFALGTRVQVQVETDTQGFAAVLHRYGFYFRPATVGIVVLGFSVAAVVYSVRQSPAPTETIAAVGEQAAPAPVDDGRVSVYFLETAKKEAATVPAPAAPAPAVPAPARARTEEPKPAVRQEPVLVASADSPRAREEATFAPERDATALASAAPAPATSPRGQAEPGAEERVAMQKSAASLDAARVRPAAPLASPAATVDVVGESAGVLRPVPPLGLEGLSGPFEGSYRLDLDASGRVSGVVRLVGGTGTEPAGLSEKLKGLSFAPAEAAGSVGAVEVRVRLR
jgi:hypothetical protein